MCWISVASRSGKTRNQYDLLWIFVITNHTVATEGWTVGGGEDKQVRVSHCTTPHKLSWLGHPFTSLSHNQHA